MCEPFDHWTVRNISYIFLILSNKLYFQRGLFMYKYKFLLNIKLHIAVQISDLSKNVNILNNIILTKMDDRNRSGMLGTGTETKSVPVHSFCAVGNDSEKLKMLILHHVVRF